MNNVSGIPTDIILKNMPFHTFDVSVSYLHQLLEQTVEIFSLQDLTTIMDILNKWDRINNRNNSFIISAFISTLAFDGNNKSYFKKIDYTDLIKNELISLKFDIDKRLQHKAKYNNQMDAEEDDLTSYFEFRTTLHTVLSIMVTSRTHLYNYLEKTIDFTYFVHLGVCSIVTIDQIRRPK